MAAVSSSSSAPHQTALPICNYCHKGKSSLKLCGKCRLVQYCGPECQKVAWKTHKFICAQNPKTLQSEERVSPEGFTRHHILALEGRLAEVENPNKIKNKYGATPEDLAAFVARPKSDEPACELLDKDGKIKTLTQREFRQISGASYTPFFSASPKTLSETQAKVKISEALSEDKIRAFEKSPPVIYYRETDQMGLEVVAGQRIKAGEIICFFGGELEGTDQEDTNDSIQRKRAFVNPTHCSGKGPFINDGFPNCGYYSLRNYRGLAFVPVVSALTDIPEGASLFVCYGPNHLVKTGMYHIPDEPFSRAAAFCKSPDFLKVSKYSLGQINQLQHIFCTSNLLFRLLLTGNLKLETVSRLMSKVEFQIVIESRKPIFYNYYPQVFSAIRKILANQNRELTQGVIDLSDSMTARSFLFVLLQMNEDAPVGSLADIEKYKAFGEILDLLYLYYNGSLTGTNIRKTEEKESKSNLDMDQIKKKFMLLTPGAKNEFLNLLNKFIEYAKKEGLNEKADSFTHLLHLLGSKKT